MKYTKQDLIYILPIISIPIIYNNNLLIPVFWFYQTSTLYLLFTNHYKNRINKIIIKNIYMMTSFFGYFYVIKSLNLFLISSLLINGFNLHYCLYLNTY